MESGQPIRCRIAACRERLDDGKHWSFYLINDCDAPLDWATLYEVGYEWGDWGNEEETDVQVADLQPGGHALIWRDDGSGAELRMTLYLRVRLRDREARMNFEFPKLYKLTDMPIVDGLGKSGWQVASKA